MRFLSFEDRHDAGRKLAAELQRIELKDPVVLGLPRGGIPVACEVAAQLKAPLDAIVVRKLGAPAQPELAIGAIAGDIRVLNDDLIAEIGLDDPTVDWITANERQELQRREELYRANRPMPDLEQRDVILVDDGLATGASMRAAIKRVRSENPSRIIVATPTGAADTVRSMEKIADRVVCLETPYPFYGVSQSYRNFNQTTDTEVRDLLSAADSRPPPAATGQRAATGKGRAER